MAVDDAYTVLANNTLSVTPPGVLANDVDADGNPLTADLVDNVQNGVLTLNSDGSFTYQPTANFHGVDSFTYKCNNGASESNVATVTITVTPPNYAPIAVDDTDFTTLNTPVTTDVLANDNDAEGDPLTVNIVSPAINGTAEVNIADNTVTYTPNTGFTGTDTYAYVCNDGIDNSNVATATITVLPQNSAPVAVDDAGVTNEDTSVTIEVLDNDTDADGNALSIGSVTQGSSGSVVINIDNSVTYMPDQDFNGSDSFTYTAFDGIADSNPATVTITVNPVNDAPVAVDDTSNTTENTSVTVNVLGNDSDVEGDPLSVSGVTQGANGTVGINADNTVTYTPNTGFTGTDSFTYTVFDGTSDSNVATVTITVTPHVNIAPVAVDDFGSTIRLSSVTINVIANDYDLDGSIDGTTVTIVEPPEGYHGTLVNNGDGTVTFNSTKWLGTTTLIYIVRDNDGIESNEGKVSITVGTGR